jgi:hypothetical protein
MSLFTPGINKVAYQGELTCPFVLQVFNPETKCVESVECKSKAIRYVEHVNQYRLRYRCRKCGQTFQYDISNRIDANPYAPYQKGRIWNQIQKVKSWMDRQGGSSKGGVK